MLHEEDVSISERMLGHVPPSDEFEREYAIRARMAHAAGKTGPLGIACMIDLFRSLGFGPAEPEQPSATTPWREMRQDGTVEMEALYDGTWRPGKFLGFVAAGTLAVRLDGSPMVYEVPAHKARLPQSTDPGSVAEDELADTEVDEEETPQPAKANP